MPNLVIYIIKTFTLILFCSDILIDIKCIGVALKLLLATTPNVPIKNE